MKIFENMKEKTVKHLKYTGLYVFRQVAICNFRDFEIAESENIIVIMNIV